MKAGKIRAGLLAAIVWLLSALAPGGAAQAQTVCPANDASDQPQYTVVTQTPGAQAQCTVTTAEPTDGIVLRNDAEFVQFVRYTAGTQATAELTATSLNPSCGINPTSIGFYLHMGPTCQFTLGWTDPNGASVTQGIVTNSNGVIEAFTIGSAGTFPTITSFTPASGPAGTVVTITGTNLSGVTVAAFGVVGLGAIAADNLIVFSATQIRMTIPSGARTRGYLSAVAPTGVAQSSTLFYVKSPPVVITTTSLPAATQAASYSATVVASGGSAANGGPVPSGGATAYLFSATGLPSGLSINSQTGAISGTPTQAGTFSIVITATDRFPDYPDIGLGGDPGSATLNLSVIATNQIITFPRPADLTFATGATVALTATASSGLAVSYTSLTPAVCTVSGTTATIVAVGMCTIKASQAGNATFAAAADVTQSFGANGTPALALSVVATPNALSAVGQVVAFSYTVRNSGNVQVTGIAVTDTRVSPVTCSATTLAAGASTTCTGTTTSTAADIVARSITGSAVARATFNAVTISSAMVATKVGIDVAAVQRATTSAIKGMLSQRGNQIASSGPDTARSHSRLGGGTLFSGSEGASAETGSGAGFTDRGIDRPRGGIGAFGGTGANGAMLGYGGQRGNGAGFGSMSMEGGFGGARQDTESGVPDIFQRLVGQQARGGISPFGRDQTSTFGGPFGMPFGWQREYPDYDGGTSRPALSPFRFTGQAEDGIGRFAFSTSLGQMREAAETQDQAKRASVGATAAGAPATGLVTSMAPASPDTQAQRPSGLGLGTRQGLVAPAASAAVNRVGSVDVWAEGSSSYFVNNRFDGRRQGHASIAHVGADTIVMPGLLLGVMGSYDWMAETSSTLGQNRDGRGWMAGPYMSARITRNLYFDARAAWGQSTNHVDPLGAYVDTFATTRALASAKVTGDWSQDAWRFRPSAEVTWFTETQKAYSNTIGIDIPGQTFSLGRTVFGPEVGYRLQFSDKSVLEPFVGLKGVWDFARTQETTAAGMPIDSAGVRGRVEAGLSYRAANGITIRGSGAYDGIGSNGYHAVQGQARLIVPLQ